MIENQLGANTLKVINDLHAQEIDSYVVLMRHSARLVDTAENDAVMDLTEEGQQAAVEFGKGLPANGRFHHLRLPRLASLFNQRILPAFTAGRS